MYYIQAVVDKHLKIIMTDIACMTVFRMKAMIREWQITPNDFEQLQWSTYCLYASEDEEPEGTLAVFYG